MIAMGSQQTFDMRKVLDAEEGERLKREGMERASLARKELLIAARCYAVAACRRLGAVCIDDVMEEIEKTGLSSVDLGNAAGSVFTPKREWVSVGWRKSKRASSHARAIRVWRLR
jgi:hypothetical protein